MSSKKHYIITSITLGLIGAASAGLIGLSNLLTRDRIARNEANKITSGITSIYGEGASVNKEEDISDHKYVNHIYYIYSGEALKGYAFKTSGSNMYGKISLILGFEIEGNLTPFVGLSIVVNEQTYATTLVDNYVTPVNNGQRDLDDVKCGATYGATLIKDMIYEAADVAQAKLTVNNNE